MIVAESTGSFTSTRASRRSESVVVGAVAVVALRLVGVVALLPIVLILITAGCGPPTG